MKKIIVLIIFFSSIVSAQFGIKNWIYLKGTTSELFAIGGPNAGAIKYDYDSLAYKIIWKNKFGQLDSGWIPLSDALSSPWAIKFEAKQREDADGNLQSQINLITNVVHPDSINQRFDALQAEILLRSTLVHVDSVRADLESLINLRASILSVDSVKTRLQAAESNILLKAGKDELDGLRDSVWSEINLRATVASLDLVTQTLNYALSQIELKAGITEVDGLRDSLWSELNLKARTAYVDSTVDYRTGLLDIRLGEAESAIDAKANITRLDSVRTELYSAVNLKARATLVDSLENRTDGIDVRVTNAEAGISAQAAQIIGLDGEVESITSSLLLYALKDSIISYINITPEEIKIAASRIDLNGAVSINGTDLSKVEIIDGGLILYGAYGVSAGGIHASTSGIDTKTLHLSGFNDIQTTANLFTFGNGQHVATEEWVELQGYQTDGVPGSRTISINGTSYDLSANRSWTVSESDPTIYPWAKASIKPSYGYAEVGAASSSHNHTGVYQPVGSYLTAETDPNVPSHVKSITSQNITDWNWASAVVDNLAQVAVSGSYNDLLNKPTLFDGTWNSLSGKPSSFTPTTHGNEAHSAAFLTAETDPNVPSHVKSITSQNITDWNWASAVVDNLAQVAVSGSYNDLINKPSLANVATSGSYNDLINKPTIPSVSFGTSWTQNSTLGGTDITYHYQPITIGTTTIDVLTSINER